MTTGESAFICHKCGGARIPNEIHYCPNENPYVKTPCQFDTSGWPKCPFCGKEIKGFVEKDNTMIHLWCCSFSLYIPCRPETIAFTAWKKLVGEKE